MNDFAHLMIFLTSLMCAATLGISLGVLFDVHNDELRDDHDDLHDEILELYDIIEQLNQTVTNYTQINYTHNTIR